MKALKDKCRAFCTFRDAKKYLKKYLTNAGKCVYCFL